MLKQVRHGNLHGKQIKNIAGTAEDEIIVFTDGTFAYFKAIILEFSTGPEPRLVDAQLPTDHSLAVEMGIMSAVEFKRANTDKMEEMLRQDNIRRRKLYEEMKKEFGDD